MKKKGFTLIELMVVVVIIGILAAIAIPNFVKVIARAKEASVKANMHTMQVAAETYNVDSSGTYPPGNTDWQAAGGYLPSNFKNPYTQQTGYQTAYTNVASGTNPSHTQGIVIYRPWSNNLGYDIMGVGNDTTAVMGFTLKPGTT